MLTRLPHSAKKVFKLVKRIKEIRDLEIFTFRIHSLTFPDKRNSFIFAEDDIAAPDISLEPTVIIKTESSDE